MNTAAGRLPQMYSSVAGVKAGSETTLSGSSSAVSLSGEFGRTGGSCCCSPCVADEELADVFWQLPALQFVHGFPLREHKHRTHRALAPLQEQQRSCELTVPLTISDRGRIEVKSSRIK